MLSCHISETGSCDIIDGILGSCDVTNSKIRSQNGKLPSCDITDEELPS